MQLRSPAKVVPQAQACFASYRLRIWVNHVDGESKVSAEQIHGLLESKPKVLRFPMVHQATTEPKVPFRRAL